MFLSWAIGFKNKNHRIFCDFDEVVFCELLFNLATFRKLRLLRFCN
jgi:hypothetical protein